MVCLSCWYLLIVLLGVCDMTCDCSQSRGQQATVGQETLRRTTTTATSLSLVVTTALCNALFSPLVWAGSVQTSSDSQLLTLLWPSPPLQKSSGQENGLQNTSKAVLERPGG